MKRFWNWFTLSNQYASYVPTTRRQVTSTTQRNYANVVYNSRLDVQITVSGDINYVLRMLAITAKQVEAADGRLTDAT